VIRWSVLWDWLFSLDVEWQVFFASVVVGLIGYLLKRFVLDRPPKAVPESSDPEIAMSDAEDESNLSATERYERQQQRTKDEIGRITESQPFGLRRTGHRSPTGSWSTSATSHQRTYRAITTLLLSLSCLTPSDIRTTRSHTRTSEQPVSDTEEVLSSSWKTQSEGIGYLRCRYSLRTNSKTNHQVSSKSSKQQRISGMAYRRTSGINTELAIRLCAVEHSGTE
jgi:hypothetical protein